MSGMPGEDGGGGEVIIFSIVHFHSVVKRGGVGTEVHAEERHAAGIGTVSVHIHDAGGFCHEGGRFGVRRVGHGD